MTRKVPPSPSLLAILSLIAEGRKKQALHRRLAGKRVRK
jgi:hypothetical protein